MGDRAATYEAEYSRGEVAYSNVLDARLRARQVVAAPAQQAPTEATALRPQPLDAGDDDAWQVLVGEKFTDEGTRWCVVSVPKRTVSGSRVAFYYDADEYDAPPTDPMLLECSSVFEVAEWCGIDVDAPSVSRAQKPRRPRALVVSSAPDRPGGARGLKPLDFISDYVSSGVPGAPGAVVSVATQTFTLQPQHVRRVSRFGLFGTTTFWLLFGRGEKSVFFFKSPERCAGIFKIAE
jgi:hypothetical protein